MNFAKRPRLDIVGVALVGELAFGGAMTPVHGGPGGVALIHAGSA